MKKKNTFYFGIVVLLIIAFTAFGSNQSVVTTSPIESTILIPDTNCTGCPPRPHNKWVKDKPTIGRTGSYHGDTDLILDGFIDWYYDEITDTYFGEYTPLSEE